MIHSIVVTSANRFTTGIAHRIGRKTMFIPMKITTTSPDRTISKMSSPKGPGKPTYKTIM
ncbi:MAG: hypothetical protein LBD15_00995 [Holosporales bacterium]|nr:hypothetical protein [Holosporales bacterium]